MLTDAHCKNAICSPGLKRERLADSGGLYLEVSPSGSKRWFWKYRFEGKEGRMALGSYPAVGLTAARKAPRDAAKIQKAEGVDPVQARKVKKLKGTRDGGDSFKAVALEWHARQESEWSSGHAERTKRQLERVLFPWIGDRQMGGIEPMELLAALQKIEERGAIETADRALMLCRQVWRYWLPTASNTQRDITEGLKSRLTPYRGSNFPAIVEPKRFGELLRAMDAYKGSPMVRTALLLAPLLYQRPGNLRSMEWSELDLDGALWTIPSLKMKRTKKEKEQGDAHVVPLPTQAVELLRNLHPLTGHGMYVFPGQREHTRPMSDNSVRSALYSLGFGDEQSWHGFRASARTMLVDQLELDPLAIEANLAHAVKDANGRSYNRTQYLTKRFDQMQQWANYLDKLRKGVDVLTLPQRAA
ncbi:integrase arm-type DNA-binding domain-containing protein [Diaphorobacter sp. HDW4B]|uniref:tyrosine-type recombinase/integrase n=1 Tax=Diaphorobacter sp. HDW4B TaxID=2714925 RepID=UPI0014085166|nr:integrase arm-type DNA-binding domain-containing protein [Diaphorobacter sp. HDW4B]QIL69250.1 integrase arm-type DNA-binding domain-containing protein [Diaphorobacter sp. HDW4B]